jgi:protein TonB
MRAFAFANQPFLPLLVSIALHFALFLGWKSPSFEIAKPEGVWVEVSPSTPLPSRIARPKVEEIKSPINIADDKSQKLASQQMAQKTLQAGVENGVQASIRERYLYELELFLNQRKNYPVRARHLELEGKVEIAFHLEANGMISDPHVASASPHPILNEAALALVQGVGKFKPLPPELGVSVLHVTVPILYELN